MSTLNAKKSAPKAAAPKGNHSDLWNIMYNHGRDFGQANDKAKRAKLDAGLDFQKLVATGKLDVSTDEKRKAAIHEAASAYDAGAAEAEKRAPSSPESLMTLRSDFGSFIREAVIANASTAYAMIADAVKGKKSKEVYSDAWQQHLRANSAITAAKGAPTKAQLVEKLTRGGGTPPKSHLEQLKALCDKIIAAKEARGKRLEAIHALVALLS